MCSESSLFPRVPCPGPGIARLTVSHLGPDQLTISHLGLSDHFLSPTSQIRISRAFHESITSPLGNIPPTWVFPSLLFTGVGSPPWGRAWPRWRRPSSSCIAWRSSLDPRRGPWPLAQYSGVYIRVWRLRRICFKLWKSIFQPPYVKERNENNNGYLSR